MILTFSLYIRTLFSNETVYLEYPTGQQSTMNRNIEITCESQSDVLVLECPLLKCTECGYGDLISRSREEKSELVIYTRNGVQNAVQIEK